MNREEDPQLWDLLGRSGRVRPSPFFARDVLRRIREEANPRAAASRFSRRRLIPTFSAVAALVLALFALYALPRRHSSPQQVATVENQDAEVAADLDVLATGDDDNDDVLL